MTPGRSSSARAEPVGDAVGSRLAQEVVGGRVTQYEYDDANRLTVIDSREHAWDENGNLVWDGVFSYTYDAANRLVVATNGITAVEYVYNGDGQRVAQVVGGVETRYTLDVAAGLAQVLVEETGGVAATYLYGLGRVAARRGSGAWRYYLHDGLGNVRAETSAAGTLLAVRSFSPFGEPIQNSDGGTPWGYTGEQWDGSAGLLYLRARYYSPALGRFISKDPFPGFAARPQTINKYAYVTNNPVNLVDPSGLRRPPPHRCEDSTCVRVRIVERGEDTPWTEGLSMWAMALDIGDWAVTSTFAGIFTLVVLLTAGAGAEMAAGPGLAVGAAGGVVLAQGAYSASQGILTAADSIAIILTILADWGAGRSDWDFRGGQIKLYIGLDEIVSVATAAMSSEPIVIPGVYVATVGDTAQVVYDLLRAKGAPGYSVQLEFYPCRGGD
jgi:RHS repeat-associated protein